MIFVIAAVLEPLRRASLEQLLHAAVLYRGKQPVCAEGSVEHLLGVVTDRLLERMLRKWNTILLLPSLCSMRVELRPMVPLGLVSRGHHEIDLYRLCIRKLGSCMSVGSAHLSPH